MRAVRSAAPGCGAPDFGCVHVATVPVPIPQAGEVLLRVNASSCGVTDMVEAGPHPWFPLGPQRLLGYNVAGTVAAVGPGVTRLKLGDAVFTMLGGKGERNGAWAEYVNVSAEGAALLPAAPPGLPMAAAATVVGPALTDWFAFVAAGAPWRFAAATPTAVIVSGSGGTGYVAVQLVKALGISKVVTAATGVGTIAWVRGLGADVVVDYKVNSLGGEVIVTHPCIFSIENPCELGKHAGSCINDFTAHG
jgi:NADPH:quinone reductase-like Zn-dependent oxidoreductase